MNRFYDADGRRRPVYDRQRVSGDDGERVYGDACLREGGDEAAIVAGPSVQRFENGLASFVNLLYSRACYRCH